MAKKKENAPQEPSLSRYYKAESVELLRSQIQLADYNPRTISDEARQTLKRGIRKYGLVGGIVVNKQTGNTLVSGHQRLSVMDELQRYDPATHTGDYTIRCDLIDLDPTQEKELVILLNNPNAQGQWDYDQLRFLVPQIDYSAAGLTDADLSMIGIDLFNDISSDTKSSITSQTSDSQLNTIADNIAAAMGFAPQQSTASDHPAEQQTRIEGTELTPEEEEELRQQRIDHMKEVKATAREQGMQRAADQMAYLMLSFDTFQNRQIFLEAFDFSPDTQIIKGEELIALLADDDTDDQDTDTTQDNSDSDDNQDQ